jgi:hypothetical protein
MWVIAALLWLQTEVWGSAANWLLVVLEKETGNSRIDVVSISGD